jgi:glycosyltransferase involved in cell wall biosynthesis
MIDNMSFSVIIPLYNKAEYVSKTIDSVLAQTYPDFELIIVDDGSKDNSLDIVRQFKDERIKIVEQENSGVSAARNRGIKEAKYELIALLDGDDWWDQSYLEEMVDLINKYPDVSIYGSQYAFVKNGIACSSKKILQMKDWDSFDLIQMGVKLKTLPILYSSGVVFRKEILKKSELFDEQISYGEDWDFFLRMGIYSKVAYMQKRPLWFYNQDVDVNKRAMGNLPPIKKHLLNYVDKYIPYYKENPYLKSFINIFILNNLYLFNHTEHYSNRKKVLLKNISIKQFSFKHIIKYYMPTGILNLMLNISRKLRGIKPLNDLN